MDDLERSQAADARNLEGALQTRAIRRMTRRAQVLARQQAARPAPQRTIRDRLRDAAQAFRA